MPVQVFADESSDDGQSGHFVMAGLLSHSENWATFSDEWDICLRSEPRIDYFKMSEAASCSGQFHRFRDNPDARDKKLRALADIINRHVRVATCSLIDLKAHSETWAKGAAEAELRAVLLAIPKHSECCVAMDAEAAKVLKVRGPYNKKSAVEA
jgi:hypothetical protein